MHRVFTGSTWLWDNDDEEQLTRCYLLETTGIIVICGICVID